MTAATRVKFCGITRLEDAQYAEALGVDALGFVFCEASKRHISIAEATAIDRALPPFISRVGLFLDAPAETVAAALDAIPGLLPQFHGHESVAFCEQFSCAYVKAFGVADGLPDPALLADYRRASAFLFDSHATGALGGTGQVFDWQALAAARRELVRGGQPQRPLILAGGLSPRNIGEAIDRVQPYAVDVSSGIESAKGIKASAAMADFIAAVRIADARCSDYRD